MFNEKILSKLIEMFKRMYKNWSKSLLIKSPKARTKYFSPTTKNRWKHVPKLDFPSTQ